MNEMSRRDLANEIAKLAILVDEDAVTGCFIIATHKNGTSTELLVPPNSRVGVEKMMFAIDRLVFRAKVAVYLQPKNVPGAAPVPPVEEQQ